MKKLLLVMGLMAGMVNLALGACTGPFCYDDTGAYIAGNLYDGNGVGLPNATAATINAATPRAKGQFVFCTDCTKFNKALGTVCMSTGTTTGAYVAVSSAAAVSNCN